MNYPDIENKQPEIVCGINCIGKSHFSRTHRDRKFKVISFTCGRRRKITLAWQTLKYARIIILGVPYPIWRERIKKRTLKRPKSGDYLGTISTTFKQIYVTLIEDFDNNNIPYILVDNRNDYPILDKSDFFTMLTESL